MALTRKASNLGILAVALMIAGLYIQSGTLILLSIVPAIYLALLASFPRPVTLEVEATRELSETRVMEGQKVKVTVRVRNSSKEELLLEARDVLAAGLKVVEGSPDWLTAIGPGETEIFTYTVMAERRGRYDLGPLKIRSVDPSGMRDLVGEVKRKDALTAIAEVEPERDIRVAPKRTRNWVGQIVSRRIGQGSEHWGLREYVQGDELRHINWKATARAGRYMTNEFEAERSGDVTIILDAREGAGEVGPRSSPLEASIRAVSTIAAHVLLSKNRVGLIVFRDCLDTVNPAFGTRQFYRISERLIDVKPMGTMPFENVGWLVTKYFPVESLVIVVSPLHDEGIVRTIADFCARGYDLVVVSPSPIVIAQERGLEGVSLGIARAERANILRELSKYARVVDWNPTEPLSASLKHVGPRRGGI